MAGTGKSTELIQLLNELDRLSELPDHLICEILCHLPTKDAVRTSVISTRWRTLWRWVPRLGLNFEDFPNRDAFVSFGDRFFDSDRVSWIDKVVLIVNQNDCVYDMSYVTSWVDAAVKRKIQHLDVRCRPYHDYFYHPMTSLTLNIYEMPRSLYIIETLVSLKLDKVALPDSEFISLPCLKTIHLIAIQNPNEATFERLFSSCPVLEEFEISFLFLNYDAKVFRVLSKSLKKLIIDARHNLTQVMIDAPRLVYLSINAALTERFTITNMDSNVKLVIRLDIGYSDFDHEESLLSNRNRFRSYLSGISKVMDMTICGNTYNEAYLRSTWLPTILESCPNLKSLSLEREAENDQELHLEEMDQINFSYVPECLLWSLEFVDFNVPLSGLAGEMNLVSYILENSAILKKLTLQLHNDCSTKDDLVKKLLKIPRGSTKCEVVFLDWKRVERTE